MPNTLVHNIAPSAQQAARTQQAAGHPRPLNYLPGGADTKQLAADLKLAVNISLSLEELEDLGAERLLELHSMLPRGWQANVAAAARREQPAANTAAAVDEFAGYDMNDPGKALATRTPAAARNAAQPFTAGLPGAAGDEFEGYSINEHIGGGK